MTPIRRCGFAQQWNPDNHRRTVLWRDRRSAYELLLTQADVGQLQMRLHVSHSSIGRTGLAFASSGDERVFGFGEQYSAFDFKGSRIPIMVDEQGLSRGAQPLTDWFDERSISAAGEWYSTYAPIPTSSPRKYVL